MLKKEKYNINKLKKFQYVNSHDSVYLCIQRGIGNAGGGILRTFNKFKGKDDLKIVYTTDAYPSHPISIQSNIQQKNRQKIKKVLLNMPKELTLPISNASLIESSNNEYKIIHNIISKLDLSIQKN